MAHGITTNPGLAFHLPFSLRPPCPTSFIGVACESSSVSKAHKPISKVTRYIEPVCQMGELVVVEIGIGCDLHGQDVTKASVKAVRDAICKTSLPGLRHLVPGGLSNMRIRVHLGVPQEFEEKIEIDRVKKVLPYGVVEVVPRIGGLLCRSGILLEDKGDGRADDRVIVAVAAVEIYTS